MKFVNNSLAFFAVILVSSVVSLPSELISKNQEIPPILKQCKKTDPNLNECLRKAIESIRQNLTEGIPELLIPPCEPLIIPEIQIQQNAGAIRMDSEYSNIVISGISNFTLRDISVDPVSNHLQADLWFPVLQMKSNYYVHGKILLMPLSGNGTAYGNFTDVDATITIKKSDPSANENETEKNERPGDIHVEFNIGGASVRLDNLFNGDAELGAMMNNFLNYNWREITAEVRPALGESIERILYAIASQLNEMYNLDELLNVNSL